MAVNKTDSSGTMNRLLTVATMADWLGVSEATATLWCKTGIIPATRQEQGWVIDRRTFNTWRWSEPVRSVLNEMHTELYDPGCPT